MEPVKFDFDESCKAIADWYASSCKKDLEWWNPELKDWNGVIVGDALFPHEYKYRIKPHMCVVNGIEILGKILVMPNIGDPYFIPTFGLAEKFVRIIWEGNPYDMHRWNLGVVFERSLDAANCTDAMTKPLRDKT